VDEEFQVTCPYCGEQVEIYVEADTRGSFVQDCEVCCNPWRVHVSGVAEDRLIYVTRADGSECFASRPAKAVTADLQAGTTE
jgi:uncharacterized Zn finger protein